MKTATAETLAALAAQNNFERHALPERDALADAWGEIETVDSGFDELTADELDTLAYGRAWSGLI